MRKKNNVNSTIEIRSTGEDNWSIAARANGLATEELPELLHAPLHQVLLAEVVTQGHVGQFRLFFLYLKQASFDRILNDQLDRGYGFCLTETVLKCQRQFKGGRNSERSRRKSRTMRSTA